MSTEHPINQPIDRITVVEFDTGAEHYRLGNLGVTLIEAVTKSGMHADIPYIRVWKDDDCYAEFCQHNILGVYFAETVKS